MTEEIIIDDTFCPFDEDIAREIFKKMDNRIQRLKQENKELKANVLKWQKAFSRQYQINENKGYSKAEENYRSALEEIREIAMGIMDDDIDEGSVYYDADQIINKINEVLN